MTTKLENIALRVFAVIGGVSTLVGLWTTFIATHDAAVSDHTMLISHDEFVRQHKDLDARLSRIETKLDAVLTEQGRARAHQTAAPSRPEVPLYLKTQL